MFSVLLIAICANLNLWCIASIDKQCLRGPCPTLKKTCFENEKKEHWIFRKQLLRYLSFKDKLCGVKYNVDTVIDELLKLSETQTQYVDERIQGLPKFDLEWRPGPYRWNILEVMEHLNRFGEFYLPKFLHAVRWPDQLRKAGTYRSGFLARAAFKRIRPVNGVVLNKTRSLKKNNPFLRILDRGVIDEHLEQQKQFRQVLEKSRSLDLSKNRIPTMVGKWLKMNMGDSLRIHGYHTERHYVQLDNLVKKSND